MGKTSVNSIIQYAPLEMREMLRSVYRYCSLLVEGGHEKHIEEILFTFSVVDRKFFIEDDPYLDAAMNIGKGQTISQPSTVAAMLLYLDIQKQERILEIGSGSGWNAALLSFLAYPGEVFSLERYLSLSEKAKRNVKTLKRFLNNKNPQESDKIKPQFFSENIFTKGKAWKSKYHKIIFTAGIVEEQINKIEEIADALLLQGGILICPRVNGPMLIFKKHGNLIKQETKEHYLFVPAKEGIEE